MRQRCAILGLVLGVLAAPAPVLPATATLAADINPEREPAALSSNFRFDRLSTIGDRVIAQEFGQSYGLWSTDGTPEGTEAFRPGLPSNLASFEKMNLPTAAFFDVQGDLWRTDGTRAGTFALSVPTLFEGDLYGRAGRWAVFFTCVSNVCGLWRSDGTVQGTTMFRQFGTVDGDWPQQPLAGGGLLYFLYFDDDQGAGFWRTDGTAAGTFLLRRFQLLNDPFEVTPVGSRIFFTTVASVGTALWVSDGTVAGTRRLTDPAGQEIANAGFVHRFGEGIVFSRQSDDTSVELWFTDGSAARTRRLAAFPSDGLSRFSSFFEQVEGRLFFPVTVGTVVRLWATGGSPATTGPVTGCPGGCPTLSRDSVAVRLGGSLLFTVPTPNSGWEIWASNGTGAGTRRLQVLCQECEAPGRFPFTVERLSRQVIFQVGDAVWRSDGTAAGTVQLLPGTFLSDATELAGRAILSARSETLRAQLWSSDGTAAGTTPLSFAHLGGGGSDPHLVRRTGDELLVLACESSEEDTLQSLWRAAGGVAARLATIEVPCPGGIGAGSAVAAGGRAFDLQGSSFTGPLELLTFGSAGSERLASFGHSLFAPRLFVVADRLYLLLHEEEKAEAALWTSDGTAGGTRHLFDIPGLESADSLTVLGSEVYFASGREVWRSDATAAGTRRVATLPDFPVTGHRMEFTRAGGAVHFVTTVPVPGPFPDSRRVLWRSDGTAAGTAPLPLAADAFGRINNLVEFGGSLYFLGGRAGAGDPRGLYRLAGGQAGLIRAFAPDSNETTAEAFFTQLADRLYFVIDDGVHGAEFWASDGTSAGTVLVRDIFPGRYPSGARALTAAGGRLLFVAGDGEHGSELWESDGTAAGTRLVQDLAPGVLSSAPDQLTPVGDRLYFAADDASWGREVWSLPLAPGLPVCRPSATALCLNGGRFRVEALWRDAAGRAAAATAVPLTTDTGTFWFFDPANVEVVLKVLDGRGLNGHFWTFYGGLSNVEYTLTVTDTQTGATRRYNNPQGRLASAGDTVAFGPRGATAGGLSIAPPAESARLLVRTAGRAAAAAPCVAGPTRLCLNGGRFALEATWRDFAGRTGVGNAVPLTGDTGTFWFFDPANIETVVKVLDGRPVNGKFWLFYGGLSNVEYTLTVIDTETGQQKTYTNSLGHFASGADTAAF